MEKEKSERPGWRSPSQNGKEFSIGAEDVPMRG